MKSSRKALSRLLAAGLFCYRPCALPPAVAGDGAAEAKEEERIRREMAASNAAAREKLDELYERMRDKTKGVSNVCPVHRLKMKVHDVPVVYGFLYFREPQPSNELREKEFPFAHDWIPGGCIYGDDFPKKGRLFLCPACIRAEKGWRKKQSK